MFGKQLFSQSFDVCLKEDVKCEDVILCERPFAAVLQVFLIPMIPLNHMSSF